MSQKLTQLINGEFRQSNTDKWIAVTNPATQELICEAPETTTAEMEEAIACAKEAYQSWRQTPVAERARLMLRYQQLLKDHQDDIARVLSRESGKTFADSKGDVMRGYEVVEHAAGIASLTMGETMRNVASGLDTQSWVHPMGVFAGITPFNFPAMIPLWMFPMAIACGNTFILKPSEQDPMTVNMLAELFLKAGAPKNLLQVIHGGKDQVNMLCTHPDIQGVSFVGSPTVGQHVYRTAAHNLKRVQCFVGAKNHMVIMPDANKSQVIKALTGSSCGAAGQRCMAISVAVFVGEAKNWIADVKEEFQKIRPGVWDDANADYGPQINVRAKERILSLIQKGKDEGASCLLDGSNCTVEGYPDGNWVGPTLFADVTTEMSLYKEEIFGPVLSCMSADSLDAAIKVINANPYGNGTSIFTASGGAANTFQREIEVGQVGVNLPTPVPPPYFSFTGAKGSFYGDQHAYGKQAVRFYTETKTVMSRWFEEEDDSGPHMTIHLK